MSFYMSGDVSDQRDEMDAKYIKNLASFNELSNKLEQCAAEPVPDAFLDSGKESPAQERAKELRKQLTLMPLEFLYDGVAEVKQFLKRFPPDFELLRTPVGHDGDLVWHKLTQKGYFDCLAQNTTPGTMEIPGAEGNTIWHYLTRYPEQLAAQTKLKNARTEVLGLRNNNKDSVLHCAAENGSFGEAFGCCPFDTGMLGWRGNNNDTVLHILARKFDYLSRLPNQVILTGEMLGWKNDRGETVIDLIGRNPQANEWFCKARKNPTQAEHERLSLLLTEARQQIPPATLIRILEAALAQNGNTTRAPEEPSTGN